MSLVTSAATRFIGWLLLVSYAAASAAAADDLRPVVTVAACKSASVIEQQAARELAEYLGKIYSQNQFVLAERAPKSGLAILVGSLKSDPDLGKILGQNLLARPESFAVKTVQDGPRQLGLIVGADVRGAVFGVYALLEKLGCGFYLSYEALPPARPTPFSFAGWDLADAPLVKTRLVFNWHNFLSGCSTWNLRDWNHWTMQAQKMGYNAIMVHAYGNNPMVSFQFNGKEKPLGFLSTTRSGRDWSTMHVNDVRRLWGGFVFDAPVFGADAAQVPEPQRGPAAQKLMREVFDYAAGRGMAVYLAVDVDTISANPQELILTLPETARFPIRVQGMSWMNQAEGNLWLANPDTLEGYAYYQSQVAALLAAYPTLSHLVVWFRTTGTPWIAFKAEEMPAAWQAQYQAELARTPAAAKLWHAHNVFALAKIATAFERALQSAGRADIRVATGSWTFDSLPAVDRFFPPQIPILPLDYNVLHDKSQLDTSELRAAIAQVAQHRPVIPIVWAQHDDGNYVGRSYPPYSAFADKLSDTAAAGFGIIHWTTRPLDLYFSSLGRQVWQDRKNEPLLQTCQSMAARSFGEAARAAGGEYLHQWITTAPKIARETSDLFIDKPLPVPADILPGIQARLKLLNQVPLAQLPETGRNRVAYYQGLERYLLDVHQAEASLQKSRALLKSNDLAAARQAMTGCRPEEIIEHYARFSGVGGITRGEQGLVVSMNLRWLSHFIRHRQLLGLEPVRYCFAPTAHDPLAQSAGMFTFFVDRQTNFWECLGNRETGAEVFQVLDSTRITRATDVSAEDIGRAGLISDQPLKLSVQPILAKGGRGRIAGGLLPPGKYRLQLYFLDPDSTASGQRVMAVSINRFPAPAESPVVAAPAENLDIYQVAGRPDCLIKRSFQLEINQPSRLEAVLKPIKGKAVISGLILEPRP